MKNFVIIYRFSDANARRSFRKMIEDQYDRLKVIKNEEFAYCCIAARHLPEVEDVLNTFIEHLSVDFSVDNGDYAAIYFTRDEDQDNIKRAMVFGTDEYVDNDIKPYYKTTHENIIIDLLNLDLINQKV